MGMSNCTLFCADCLSSDAVCPFTVKAPNKAPALPAILVRLSEPRAISKCTVHRCLLSVDDAHPAPFACADFTPSMICNSVSSTKSLSSIISKDFESFQIKERCETAFGARACNDWDIVHFPTNHYGFTVNSGGRNVKDGVSAKLCASVPTVRTGVNSQFSDKTRPLLFRQVR